MSEAYVVSIRDLVNCQDAEVIPLSKINDHGKTQHRFIALTPTEFLSIKKSMLGGYSIRRRATYDQITGFVRHTANNSFVVKFDRMFLNDYRYISEAGSRNFCQKLLQRKPLLSIWTLDIDLFSITRIKHNRGDKQFLDVFQMMQDDRDTYLESGAEGANRA